MNPLAIKKAFPIFTHKPELVYLDSAATALKPQVMVDAMNAYYLEYSANVGRGIYPMAEEATLALEQARKTVAGFLNAENEKVVVFTANATQAINIVALGLESEITRENNIIVTDLEHHSNSLPWKELARQRGAELRSARFTKEGTIDTNHLATLVDDQTAVISFSAVSNVFGVVNPVKELVQSIRKRNKHTLVLIDACQAVGHIPIDIKSWDADFVVFSGHKLFGPTGIGVLAGKQASLKRLVPRLVGGGTVLDAFSKPTKYKPLPENLEGGTPNIAGVIGLAKAIEYVESLGLPAIRLHETKLIAYALEKLQATFGAQIHILGTLDSERRASIIAFSLDGIHPHDLAHLLGEKNICVRAGEHCASPLHRALNLPATTRVSLSIYNTKEDIDRLCQVMTEAQALFLPKAQNIIRNLIHTS